VTIFGDAALGVLERPSSDSCFIFPGRRDRTPHAEILYLTRSGEPDWVSDLAHAARVLDADEVARRRIAAGIPAVPQDIGPNDLPNEGGLEAEAISYTKGCYLGQEVMARLKSMGRVRRRLVRVRGNDENQPPLLSPLFVGARAVGDLRSAARDGTAGWIGLAMISLVHVAGAAELSLSVDSPPTVRVMDMP
jgi:tRNA-modifying protein YgfZ